MTAEPAVLYEKRDGIAVVTMNRPAVHNAINTEMLCRLADAWQDVNDDPAVRVAILTGAGTEAFCAGADLKKLIPVMLGTIPPENAWDERVKAETDIIYKGLLRNYTVWKPLVAAVRGWAVAGGTEILTTTDLRIAATDAVFGLAEVKWSLFPMGGSSVRLPRQISRCNAMEILLMGEQISAQRAYEMGLVNRVVAPEAVMPTALAFAEVLKGNGPLAVQAIKRSVVEGMELSPEQALARELELGIPVSMSEDCREGNRAFREKRKPVYHGR